MPVKRYPGPVSLMRVSPKPSAEKAKSLSIHLSYGAPQASVEIDLTSNEAMLLLRSLQTFQKRYGWPSASPRVITRRDMH